ncbi:hypothetical protein K435DRAFT_821260 [Dendrothele bispora CBS 962.96]|uniref:C2H2-type domain-containing protein n=1 Tax=Dendrothele bispora (strain CBS 962.96) TaxID=1314807 RepID=A0A4S8LLR7_DENBC|nr:hypothetical protein K435DRAFT_821260 [Dendrothele bispora CBS 962.96]
MSNDFACSGCSVSYKRINDLNLHWIKTNHPKCIKKSHRPKFSSQPFNSTPMISDKDEQDEPDQFVGDFFGQDYGDKDFPGFGTDKDDISSDKDNGEISGSDNDEPGYSLEPVWEPSRPQPAVVVESMDDDDMILTPPRRPPNVPLRNVPAHRDGIHVVKFGGQAGAAVSSSPNSGSQSFRNSSEGFNAYKASIQGSDRNQWAPFTSRMDWEVARWAKLRGTGSTAFDDLLAIKGVDEALGLSYRNSKELNHIIDSIPPRRPSFTREEVVIAGEAFDIYKRDILECIRALYGNPDHCKYMCFVPERHYAHANHTIRLFHDFHTGKWWWATQKAVEADKPGATIVPVILSSDKAQVTLFRNKSAYPVYLTIGNLPKEIRRKPSQQGQVLLAYLPTTRLEHIKNKVSRRQAVTNLFHSCMKNLLAPLETAGIDGVELQSGDGVVRRCHPILAAYVGDYPEQVLITTVFYGDCATCPTEKDELGDYPCREDFRSMADAVSAAKMIGTDVWTEHCFNSNIKPVQHPFWEDLPYTDIFRSITPDLLHQLYQGVMKHLIEWLSHICSAEEIDARVRRLPPSHGMRQFHKGITTLSRVSGAEHKQMCSFLLGLIIDIPSLSVHQSRKLLTATRSLLDFLYTASFPIHTTETLKSLDESLETFHIHKQIFVDLGAREHFNLPKLHSLAHYSRAIQLYDTTDNYNTETTERLHIDFTKDAYHATNHKDEYAQMTLWLERQEKVTYHATYIEWRSSCPPVSPPGLVSMQPIDMKCIYQQKFINFPSVKSVGLSKLEDTVENRGYGASQLTDALALTVLPFTSVPVWHSIKFINEDLYGKETLDVVLSRPRRYGADGQITQRFQFDVVMVKMKDSSLENEDLVRDMRLARVCAIFSISDKSLRTVLPSNLPPPKHLAYVEWFTKFNLNPDSITGLYRVKLQMKPDGTRAVSVIPASMIQRSINLFPKWDGPVHPSCTSEKMLDTCTTFFVNPFRNHHTYINIG